MTTSFENEPLRLVLDGGGSFYHHLHSPPSKTSHYGSFSTEVVVLLPSPSTSFKNEPLRLVFDGGGCFYGHLYPPPSKRAITARFQRRWLFLPPPPLTSFENEPLRLVFDGGGCSTTTSFKTSHCGSFSVEVVISTTPSTHLHRKRAVPLDNKVV
jgi:hypothetical protein